ncbi:MAG TPA: S8 family serine peptidase, partial [Acidimicrobiales bacterium]|nr:S8 family serine peptidase [Acidimicrobiales bacterium]
MPLSSSASAGHVPALPPGAVPKEQAIVVLKSPCPSRATPGATCPPQRPVVAELEAARARVLSTTTLVDTITAEVTPAQARALAASPLVSEVVPDGQVRLAPLAAPALPSQGKFAASNKLPLRAHGVAPASLLCGARAHPELDPQALQAVTANRARAMGAVGAGVTVAILADGLHATNADLLRNAAYGRYATHVVTQYVDFTGEGTRTKTGGEEAFGDVSSIAAQANTAYNLSQYVNPAVAALFPKSGCWVKILGTAPGASLMVLKVIGSNDLGTDSGIVEAIQYAVQHGAKVINESFGGNPAPDTGLDVVRQADDAAVAAGVTVVVSSGDGGPTSTIGS